MSLCKSHEEHKMTQFTDRSTPCTRTLSRDSGVYRDRFLESFDYCCYVFARKQDRVYNWIVSRYWPSMRGRIG